MAKPTFSTPPPKRPFRGQPPPAREYGGEPELQPLVQSPPARALPSDGGSVEGFAPPSAGETEPAIIVEDRVIPVKTSTMAKDASSTGPAIISEQPIYSGYPTDLGRTAEAKGLPTYPTETAGGVGLWRERVPKKNFNK